MAIVVPVMLHPMDRPVPVSVHAMDRELAPVTWPVMGIMLEEAVRTMLRPHVPVITPVMVKAPVPVIILPMVVGAPAYLPVMPKRAPVIRLNMPPGHGGFRRKYV
jgi:hypothetical protein